MMMMMKMIDETVADAGAVEIDFGGNFDDGLDTVAGADVDNDDADADDKEVGWDGRRFDGSLDAALGGLRDRNTSFQKRLRTTIQSMP